MFQPLIGTIKTLKEKYKPIPLLFVSTPYRDDKNRVREKRSVYMKYQFQPLIGTIKTLHNYSHQDKLNFVSTPYRDDKNEVKL